MKSCDDEKWTAVALLFGRPRQYWITNLANFNLEFRMVVDQVFGGERVLQDYQELAREYAIWYFTQEKELCLTSR